MAACRKQKASKIGTVRCDGVSYLSWIGLGFGVGDWPVSDVHPFAGSRLLQTTQRHDRHPSVVDEHASSRVQLLASYCLAPSIVL